MYLRCQISYQSPALPLLTPTLRPIRQTRRAFDWSPAARACTLVLLVDHDDRRHLITSPPTLLPDIALDPHPALLPRGVVHISERQGLAVLAAAAAAAWFFLVAPGTQPYLSFVFRRTVDAIGNAAQGTHTPFQASAGALNTPIVEQVVSFAGVLLVSSPCCGRSGGRGRSMRCKPDRGVPGGVWSGSLAFYPLRLFPGAWETGNRGQEFLFVGAALLLGLALVRVAGPSQPPPAAC